jgi:hypothetical protein
MGDWTIDVGNFSRTVTRPESLTAALQVERESHGTLLVVNLQSKVPLPNQVSHIFIYSSGNAYWKLKTTEEEERIDLQYLHSCAHIPGLTALAQLILYAQLSLPENQKSIYLVVARTLRRTDPVVVPHMGFPVGYIHSSSELLLSKPERQHSSKS